MNAKEVIKIRKANRLTQKGLAEKIGVSVRTVQNWEAGATKVSQEYASLLKKHVKPSEPEDDVVNEYLLKAFGKLGKSQKEVMEDLDIAQPLASVFMNGKRMVGREWAKKLSDIYGFDYESVLSGVFIPETEKLGRVSYRKDQGRPFYDVDFTLGFKDVDNDIELHPEFNIDFPPANRDTINWFRAKGNSMLGEINSGDYIALEEVQDFSWFSLGRIYAVVTKNGFRTIKRVVKSDRKDEYVLVSSNPDKIKYPDQSIPKDMIHKIYKVVHVIRYLEE